MHKDKNTLLKRARSKYLSKHISLSLYHQNPNSTLKNSYYGSLLCSHNLYQEGRRLQTSYCKQRWCAVCNRIKTAKLISGYLPVLEEMKQPYFVTLTKKTVSGDLLKDNIDFMEKTWRKILHSDSGKKKKIRGIRKSECTIRPAGQYHFHFHIIVDGKEAAEWLIQSWLSRLPEEANIIAQDYKPADANSLKEMFKYFTKLLTTTGKDMKKFYPTRRMDVIFKAMKGKRVVQSFGGIRAVNEDLEDLNSQIYDLLEDDIDTWKWRDTDWYNSAGIRLTGYDPTEKFKLLVDSLSSDNQELQ